MTRRSITRCAAAPLAALLLAACGGGSSPPPAQVTPGLTVSPAEWSVAAGGAAKQFAAVLTGSSGPVVWAVETAGIAAEVGTVSAGGLYTPPATLGAARDVVVAATAGTLVARATVHVAAGADGVSLSVSPTTGSAVAGSTQTVAVAATTNYSGPVTWSLAPMLGTLDAATGASVVYTAPTDIVVADTTVTMTATAGMLTAATTITVRPTVFTVGGPANVYAGGAPVSYVLTPDPGANTVAWSVVPASAGTVSGTGTTCTFTPAASAGAATPFQVVATIGSTTGSASSTLQSSLGPVNVAGRVVDQHGVGFAGRTVIVGGASTTTSGDGSFSFSNVAAPYTLTAIVGEAMNSVKVFREVTTSAPIVELYRDLTSRSATVSGKVTLSSVGTYADVFGLWTHAATNATGDYSCSALWQGSTAATVTLRALDVARAGDGTPSAYWLGARDVAVTDGVPLGGQDIALAALTGGSVSGSSDPRYWSDSKLRLVADFDDGISYTAWEGLCFIPGAVGCGGGPFALTYPVLPGGHVDVRFSANSLWGGAGASTRASPGLSGIDLTLPDPPSLSEPAEGAIGVGYGTALSWTGTNAGGHEYVYVNCLTTSGSVGISIHGGGRSATIPDLSAYGVTIPPGEGCYWSVKWESYGVEELLLGPAAIDALASKRWANTGNRNFKF
ncbi:MAG: hypothetical protein WCC48_19610 [Anaeromyxobacteraceae bacterium]